MTTEVSVRDTTIVREGAALDLMAALGSTETRLIAALNKLGADTSTAVTKLQRTLTAQTQAVTKSLRAAIEGRDLRAAGPQVLGLIAAVHGASSRCNPDQNLLITAEVQGLLADIRSLRRAITTATGTETETIKSERPTATCSTGKEEPPFTPLSLHADPSSPWAVASITDIDQILNNRHPRYDVYRVEDDRLATLVGTAEGARSRCRWSLSLAVRSILQEHKRQITFYGTVWSAQDTQQAEQLVVGPVPSVPRLTVLTALRRIGAEPSDVIEHAIEIDQAVERQLSEDDFLCYLVVDAPLLSAYKQWCLFRPMCHFAAGYLHRIIPSIKDASAQFPPQPAKTVPPQEAALEGAVATMACAVLHVLRSIRYFSGSPLSSSNIALTPAEWVGLQAEFDRWARDQAWSSIDTIRLALTSPLQLRLYPSCLRQVLIDKCWDRVRTSRGPTAWSMAFWERVGVTHVTGYQPPSPASKKHTGCPFVANSNTNRKPMGPGIGPARPVACTSKIPTLDPRFEPAYMRSHREATEDDLCVDQAFNAAGEGSEIDEEELIMGCELPPESGGFGPLTQEDTERLAKAGERLAERLANVVHVDLPTQRYDPASKFFFGREHPFRQDRKRPKRKRDQTKRGGSDDSDDNDPEQGEPTSTDDEKDNSISI